MTDQQLYTILELYLANGREFPFWISNSSPRHYIAKVIGFGYFFDQGPEAERNGKPRQKWQECPLTESYYRQHFNNVFLCDLYTLDKQHLMKKRVSIPAHRTKSWLPA